LTEAIDNSIVKTSRWSSDCRQ